MTTTNKMTRKDALTHAIKILKEQDVFGYADENAVAVLEKMLAQINKPRAASTPSKSQARVSNEIIVYELADMVETGSIINSSWVVGHSPYGNGQYPVLTPQKVTGIMKVACELGFFERVKDGKAITYVRQ